MRVGFNLIHALSCCANPRFSPGIGIFGRVELRDKEGACSIENL